MPYLVRIPIDLVLPNAITGDQLNRVAKKIEDYAGSVVAHAEFGQVTKETQPGSSWHIHDGKSGCGECAELRRDRKNADDPKGED